MIHPHRYLSVCVDRRSTQRIIYLICDVLRVEAGRGGMTSTRDLMRFLKEGYKLVMRGSLAEVSHCFYSLTKVKLEELDLS